MPISIRQADLDSDRDLLIGFLRENLTQESNDRRFDWLYRGNPDGEARVWVAYDATPDNAIGVAAAFPRRVLVRGAEVTGWSLGDFVIRKEYRTLGPALKLQRACIDPIKEGEIPFCYDYPSRSMLSTYQRLGISTTSREVRCAKLLNLDKSFGMIARVPFISSAVCAAGSALLALRDRIAFAGRRNYAISKLDGAFGEEFTDLDRRLRSAETIRCLRHSGHLNWRYREHPFIEYEVLIARAGDRLAGYAVFCRHKDTILVTDLISEGPAAILREIIAVMVGLLRPGGARTLNIPLLESDRTIPDLRKLGFHLRERSPVVVCRPPADSGVPAIQAANLFLTFGDRLV